VTSTTHLQALAAQSAELLPRHPWKFWFWGDSIGFEGLLDAAEFTKETMHSDGPLFAKLYQVTGQDLYRRLALINILSQIELLYDPVDGLFHHFWMERSKSRNGIAWGRGNGWGLLGMVDTLEYLPAGDAGTQRMLLLLRKLLARVADLQDKGGGWRTVLNDSGSYIETSISAFMICAMSRAIRRAWVTRDAYLPVVENAMAFLLKNIRSDGVLEGVSYETFPSTNLEHYRSMPRGGMVPWGQGAFLASLWSYAQLRTAPPNI